MLHGYWDAWLDLSTWCSPGNKSPTDACVHGPSPATLVDAHKRIGLFLCSAGVEAAVILCRLAHSCFC